MRIAHLSDTHFGTELPEVESALLAMLPSLQPDLVVVSGDITQRARASQFDAAAAFLERLPPVPKLLVPGNHDLPLFNLPMRLLLPDHGYRRVFGATEQRRQLGTVAVLGFDTTRRWRHTRGDLDVGHLRATLAALGPTVSTRIVVLHQPLHTALDTDRDECLLSAADIADALADCTVDLVLSGHVHMPLLSDTREIFPRLSRHFVLSGAGTALSWRVRAGAPNSLNLLELDEDGRHLSVTLYAFDAGTQAFTPALARHYLRVADGWQQRHAPENLAGL